MATDTDPSVEIHGYALRHIRMLTGVSTQELAERVEKTDAYVRRIENGSSQRVSAALYRLLLSVLAIKDYRVLLANPHRVSADSSEPTTDPAPAVVA